MFLFAWSLHWPVNIAAKVETHKLGIRLTHIKPFIQNKEQIVLVHRSETQFAMQRFPILLLVIAIFALAAADARASSNQELQNAINCKSVCGDCRCRGYYCGEECICECDSENEEDIRCLATMHNKCKKLRFPFEVLIQGPSGNRFMRSALLFEEIYQQCLKHDAQNKRKTIVLYKPQQKRFRRQAEDGGEEPAPPEEEPIVGAPQQSPPENDAPSGTDGEQVPAAAEESETNVDAPTVGIPLALALPAARAKSRLTLTTIRAQYEAALARLRARLAATRPFLIGAGAAAGGIAAAAAIPKPPPLPVQPLFTF